MEKKIATKKSSLISIVVNKDNFKDKIKALNEIQNKYNLILNNIDLIQNEILKIDFNTTEASENVISNSIKNK